MVGLGDPGVCVYIYIYIHLGAPFFQGTIGCTANSVPMVFIVFNLGILGDEITHKYLLYRAYIRISHKGTSNYPLFFVFSKPSSKFPCFLGVIFLGDTNPMGFIAIKHHPNPPFGKICWDFLQKTSIFCKSKGGGFVLFFFSPFPGGMIQFDEYLSNGLVQPPTRFGCLSSKGEGQMGLNVSTQVGLIQYFSVSLGDVEKTHFLDSEM